MASDSSVQALVQLRSERLRLASESRDAATVASWYSKDAIFRDPVKEVVHSGADAIGKFYEGVYQAIPTFKVVESKTTAPTAEFVAAEMTCEAIPGFDLPDLDIKKGEKLRMKGVSLFWWTWEGPGDKWDGSLSEEQVRGWKISEEHVYFTSSKGS